MWPIHEEPSTRQRNADLTEKNTVIDNVTGTGCQTAEDHRNEMHIDEGRSIVDENEGPGQNEMHDKEVA